MSFVLTNEVVSALPAYEVKEVGFQRVLPTENVTAVLEVSAHEVPETSMLAPMLPPLFVSVTGTLASYELSVNRLPKFMVLPPIALATLRYITLPTATLAVMLLLDEALAVSM